ncbi:MAG TPA: TVP38/TMEM64 family protein [Gemmatimonadaceae bacterium]|jgi:uncharacterized membrane protein YdjX (TVP38/TMEM64 family)
MGRESPPSPPPRTRTVFIRIGGLALLLAVGTFTGYKLGWFDYSHTLQHIAKLRKSENLGLFVVGFVLVYGLLTSFGLPGLPFNVAAGALFGSVIGGVLAWIGSLLGATAGYWLARTVGHNEVSRWVKRYKRVDAAVAQARDFSGMLRLRLVPVLPIGVVNFVGGLAKAPFLAYLAATALGIIPSVVIYSYFADSLVEGVGSGRKQALVSLIIASTLLILLSLLPRLFRSRTATPVDEATPSAD